MPTCARPSRATACRPTSGSSGHDRRRARAGDRGERGAGRGAGRRGGVRGRGLARARACGRGGGGARRGCGSRGGARSAGAAPAGGGGAAGARTHRFAAPAARGQPGARGRPGGRGRRMAGARLRRARGARAGTGRTARGARRGRRVGTALARRPPGGAPPPPAAGAGAHRGPRPPRPRQRGGHGARAVGARGRRARRRGGERARPSRRGVGRGPGAGRGPSRRLRRSRYGQARRRGAQLQLRRRPGLRLRVRRRAGRGPHPRAVLLAPRRGGDARARRGHGRRPRLPRRSPAPPGRRRGAGRRLAPGGALVLRGLGADVGARRVDASLRGPQAARDVKLGRGGIREVEFFVQAQQLVHGGKDPRLQVRSTLGTLAALAATGYVEPELAVSLAAAYRFLRDVEHKLQIVQERRTQSVPSDPDALLALARRLGFRGAGAAAEFEAARARHGAVVRGAFAALFHGAEEERRREAEPELALLIDELDQPERALWRLGRLGFRDLESAYRELRLLRDGPSHAPASARRRAALVRLAPALLTEIARSAAPERALHHLATFVSTIGARTSYLHLLLENPGVMRLLVRLFATSEFLSAFFLRHPELLDSLVRADLMRIVRAREDMAAELGARLAAAPDLEARLDTLRRFRHEEFLRIGVHDIEGTLEPAEVGRQLTSLAETCLAAALAIARGAVLARSGVPDAPESEGLAVLGLGKLGGGELAYASDLDLIFVYDPGDLAWWNGRAVPHEFFTRIAERTISALATPTREGIAYRIDTRLRPSGNQGPLVSSLAAFATYHRTGARLWERQALIKARVVAGAPALGARLEAIVAEFVCGRGRSPAEVAAIADMRARIERERGAADGEGVNIKTGRGGLIDVEFLGQMLQLRHGYAHPAVRVRDTPGAIGALAAAGLLLPADARALAEGYAFLRALERRLRLEHNQPLEVTAADPAALLALARRLGYGGTDAEAVAALRADHTRHGEAIRAVYDRHFAVPAR